MKKRLLLTLFAVTLFTVVLALSVGASTIYKDAEGNTMFSYELDEKNIISTYTGEFPRVDGEGNHLTWYVTKTETVDGDTVKTVASFKTMDEGYMTLSNGTYTYKGGTGATNKNIVAVSFPNDSGINVLNLSDGGYHSTYNYEKNTAEILFVYLPNTLTTLPDRVVQATRALVCDIPLETPITRISHVAFHASKCLREINIPATVTIIDGRTPNDGAAFYMCDSLERVNVGENSVLETIGNYAFHNCINLKYIKIPDSVKSIGSHAFSYTDLRERVFYIGIAREEHHIYLVPSAQLHLLARSGEKVGQLVGYTHIIGIKGLLKATEVDGQRYTLMALCLQSLLLPVFLSIPCKAR